MGSLANTARRVAQTHCRHIRAGILVERRYLSQAQPLGMIQALRDRGDEVMVIDPEAVCFRAGDDAWLTGLDVVVARGRSWAVLCLLSWAEARGVPTINRRTAVSSVHNKADMAIALRAAGFPVPLTVLGSPRELAERFGARDYPIILKPVFGDNGHGLRVARNAHELRAIDWPERIALAQRLVPTDGYDLKLYCIGEHVWAVRKPSAWASGARFHASHAELVPLAPRWRPLAQQCRRLFGLELFGIDCVQTPRGAVVIEVNEFPNYSGIPMVNERLADYVSRRAGQEKTL